MSDVNEFRKALELDKHNLDQCALEQPELFAEWALKWADAVNDRDRAKDQLALAKSEADTNVRSSPKEYGWVAEKAPTEAFISSAIASDVGYIKANEVYMTACHSVNVLSIAKEAFEQRRKMIEVLTQLYVSSYFSGNKAFDKSYQAAVETVNGTAQEEALASNPRLQRLAAAKTVEEPEKVQEAVEEKAPVEEVKTEAVSPIRRRRMPSAD